MLNKEISINDLINTALERGEIKLDSLLYLKCAGSDEEKIRRLNKLIKDNKMAACITKTINDAANGIVDNAPKFITIYDNDELNPDNVLENVVKESKEIVEEIPVIDKTFKPDYYKSGNMNVINFCEYHNLDFSTGNCIKYLVKAGKKDSNTKLIDLKKAQKYINRLIISAVKDKELDRDDIESLGWKKSSLYEYRISVKPNEILQREYTDDDIINLDMHYDQENNPNRLLQIYYGCNCLYKGAVRNKSELINLMANLGIRK
jgi:hypothetical protein